MNPRSWSWSCSSNRTRSVEFFLVGEAHSGTTPFNPWAWLARVTRVLVFPVAPKLQSFSRGSSASMRLSVRRSTQTGMWPASWYKTTGLLDSCSPPPFLTDHRLHSHSQRGSSSRHSHSLLSFFSEASPLLAFLDIITLPGASIPSFSFRKSRTTK